MFGLLKHPLLELLLSSGASKSGIFSKQFMSIPERLQQQLCKTRMTFQVANREVLTSKCMGTHSNYISSFVTWDLGDIYCIFGLDAEKIARFITFAWAGRNWFNENEHDELE